MILIAFGSNLGASGGLSPADRVRTAWHEVAGLAGLTPIALSRLWDTAPVAGDPSVASGQDRYINAVGRLEGHPDPVGLLNALHAIEARNQRVRRVPDMARTLDLDLIDVNGSVRENTAPVLPHPRAHLRAFVLMPLHEVAPDWRHPVLGEDAAALIDRLRLYGGLAAQDCRALP